MRSRGNRALTSRSFPSVGPRPRLTWPHLLAWGVVLATAPGMTCPPAAPPPTLPLPPTADPPRAQEIRAHVVAGAGTTDRSGSVLSGGAVRVDYAPINGLTVGFELGGGIRRNRAGQIDASGAHQETSLSGRLQTGYGLWLRPKYVSFAAEAGLTTGLHSEKGGFVGPDLTLSLTAGGQRWWASTVSYRLAYMIPSRSTRWSQVLYHVAALTFSVPRSTRYSGFLQIGLTYGHLMRHQKESLGLVGLVGFRFAYAR